MDKNDMIGAAQIAGGTYLGYQGIKHGLPRAAGIRIEYHTTSKENAGLIKKGGNILDPAFGGKNGWAKKVNSEHFVNNSKGFVHITGMHDSLKPKYIEMFKQKIPLAEYLVNPMATLERVASNIMYRTVGNVSGEEFKKIMTTGNKTDGLKWFFKQSVKNLFKNKTKKFCIPGIDSYFNKNFIPDCDSCAALKSTKPLKAFNNRFSAMIEGLKNFGLKGMKENKGRVAFGISLLALGTYSVIKLIKKGIQNFSKN